MWVAAGSSGVNIRHNFSDGLAIPITGDSGTAHANILRLDVPITGSVAIAFNNGSASDNVIIGFETGLWPGDATYPGVTDGGGNVIIP